VPRRCPAASTAAVSKETRSKSGLEAREETRSKSGLKARKERRCSRLLCHIAGPAGHCACACRGTRQHDQPTPLVAVAVAGPTRHHAANIAAVSSSAVVWFLPPAKHAAEPNHHGAAKKAGDTACRSMGCTECPAREETCVAQLQAAGVAGQCCIRDKANMQASLNRPRYQAVHYCYSLVTAMPLGYISSSTSHTQHTAGKAQQHLLFQLGRCGRCFFPAFQLDEKVNTCTQSSPAGASDRAAGTQRKADRPELHMHTTRPAQHVRTSSSSLIGWNKACLPFFHPTTLEEEVSTSEQPSPERWYLWPGSRHTEQRSST
jgi:hypothetical protein